LVSLLLDHLTSLGFAIAGSSYFMKILQAGEYTHHLFLAGPEPYEQGTHCITYAMRPNGELVHLVLTRISQDKVTLQVRYKMNNLDGVTCEHTLPAEAAKGMDGPFDLRIYPNIIISHDSALLFHMYINQPSKA
ncbi:hypothetical protein PENTCL1PPCAC_21727, partial [Pristionchus entomophagus]